ncbi:MAG: twin-arginine translocation signal domain-containing protein, partial [Deltaproteobacteria bacterium]
MRTRRRDFLKTSLALLAARGGLALNPQSSRSWKEFQAYQAERRKELWSLLGDLPWDHTPGPPKLIKRERHEGFTLERLVLDLNGLEPVPALLLIPDRRDERAPGLLFIHWHAGMYEL